MSSARRADPITVSQEHCQNFDRSSRLEWLETDGTGGYAMGTVAGVNTRAYHSSLLASLQPPVKRYVFLSRVEDTVLCDSREIPLATVQYPGNLALCGFRHLAGFRLAPYPTWRYEWPGGWLEKRLFLVYGAQTSVTLYTAGQPCTLRLKPMLAFRDYHQLASENESWNRELRQGDGWFSTQPYLSLPALHLHYGKGSFQQTGVWYHRHEYLEELNRGLPFHEDLYTPGDLTLALDHQEGAYLVATLRDGQSYSMASVQSLAQAEQDRRASTQPDLLLARLHAAADQFVARRADGKATVIAGYPWFADWGRDSMISLPGLFIARGLLTETRDLIEGFLRYCSQGLIPNRFPDSGETPEYNTVDATLWMFQAVHHYLQAKGDPGFLRDVFYPAAKLIVHWHEVGTRHGIGVDPEDGLLAANDPTQQLTWMDAKVDGWVVTPRHGKPVEIQALWYSALRLMADWADSLADTAYARDCSAKADRVLASFRAKFWNSDRNCLYDVVARDGPDARMRPNQILAVSLAHSLLPPEQQRAVVTAVQRDLLTPLGLRSLAAYEPEYHARYEGDRVQRDSAYHQGTVWPWLIGPYISAYLRAFGRGPAELAACRDALTGLAAQLFDGCLGSISEIFDGDAPRLPRGCTAQAWSVAEMLRVLTFDLGAGQQSDGEPET